MNRFFQTRFLALFLLSGLLLLLSSSGNRDEKVVDKTPKYIFLFIGDGMGFTHVALTEAYLKNLQGKMGFERLTMTQFPVFGQCETYSKDNQITESAAAGSAIACGAKANNNEISYFENHSSIAKIARDKGLKVGVISTVSIDHATPATFYARNKNRNNYYEIASQLPESNFHFFGGGGFNVAQDQAEYLKQKIQDYGYTIHYHPDKVSKEDEKVMLISPVILGGGQMPYSIDRKFYPQAVGLPEIVQSAVNFLKNENGFFMMVEGGAIDWCSHENDAATIVHEIKDFDDAVRVAYNFYLQYPDETLIIVTSDHETGGMSMGVNGSYDTNFAFLKIQKSSIGHFSSLISRYKRENKTHRLQDVIDLAQNHFYAESMKFTESEMNSIKRAFDYYFNSKTDLSKEELSVLYGGYNPVAVAFTRIVNNRAAVGFTSWGHTGTRVPVYSIGNGSEKFSGAMNNTDINPKIKGIMGW